MTLPLSIFIITKNEADRIVNVINLVKNIADEILVIDSGSQDDTVDLAIKNGAKVIYNEWHGYGQQKIFGESQCKNDWILNIDADEEVSPKLASEISDLFQSQKIAQNIAYKVKIVNKFRFEKAPKKLAYYYNQLRLYNKKFAGFKDSPIHDSVAVFDVNNTKIGQLQNIIYHQSFRSISHWITKINSYSSMQAQDALEKNKKVSLAKIFLTPTFAFIKAYFIRRYFIYGFDGFIYSYLFAFSRFAKLIKIREIFKKQKYDKN